MYSLYGMHSVMRFLSQFICIYACMHTFIHVSLWMCKCEEERINENLSGVHISPISKTITTLFSVLLTSASGLQFIYRSIPSIICIFSLLFTNIFSIHLSFHMHSLSLLTASYRHRNKTSVY